MKSNDKINFITLWKLNDWGMYNRRDEAILWELSRRDTVKSVMHVEHVALKGLLSRIKQWIRTKDKALKRVYCLHIKKGFSLKPIPVNNEKKYYIYSIVILYSGSNFLLKKINNFFLKYQFQNINKHFIQSKTKMVLIVYPTSRDLSVPIKAIKHDLLVADFEDDVVERIDDIKRKNQLKENYNKLLPECNWIFSTSSSINQKYRDYAKKEIDFIPNGVDMNIYGVDCKKKFNKKGERKVVGYTGVLNYEADFDLLEHVVSSFPDVDFVLIGFAANRQLKDIKRLTEQYRNLYYYGMRSYVDIPGYISNFDVLISFKRDDHTTSGGDSQKIYEYLSTGKPIVSTPVPPANHFTDLMYVTSDKFQFADFLKKALEEDDAMLREKRVQVAIDNSWSKRVDIILEKVSKLL